MNYQPVDEKHLEHLISSEMFSKVTKIQYLGPVLDPSGKISTSPDMLILDKRNGKDKIITCECKYSPLNKSDFAHNGNFDIAIIWECKIDLKKLEKDLSEQNNCREILVLSNITKFNKLEKYPNFLYSKEIQVNSKYLKALESKLRKGKEYTSFVAYISAKIYPKKFNAELMKNLLLRNFQELKRASSKGIANSYSALAQAIERGKPERIIERKGEGNYLWNNELINSKIAIPMITEIIIRHFEGELPSNEDIESVISK